MSSGSSSPRTVHPSRHTNYTSQQLARQMPHLINLPLLVQITLAISNPTCPTTDPSRHINMSTSVSRFTGHVGNVGSINTTPPTLNHQRPRWQPNPIKYSIDNKLSIKSTPTTIASFSRKLPHPSVKMIRSRTNPICTLLNIHRPLRDDEISSQLLESQGCLATTLDHSFDCLSSQDSRQHILEQFCYPSCTRSVPLGYDAESITQCTTVARKPIAMPNLTSPVVVSPLISTHVIQTSLLLYTIDHGLIPCSTCLCINLELSCSTRRE